MFVFGNYLIYYIWMLNEFEFRFMYVYDLNINRYVYEKFVSLNSYMSMVMNFNIF